MSRYREYSVVSGSGGVSAGSDLQLLYNSSEGKMDKLHSSGGGHRPDPSSATTLVHHHYHQHHHRDNETVVVDLHQQSVNSQRTSSLPNDSSKDGLGGADNVSKNDPTIRILCFDLGSLPRGTQFLVCCGSVFFFYIIYGYFMELIFRLEGFRPFGWFLTLLQFAWYSIFGALESHIKREHGRKAPLRSYVLIAFLSVATIGLSNSSMGYLNFPTQQIFKSCKLIPVMIGGVIIQGKRYGLLDVTACVSMCMGLAIFTIADSTISPNFDTYGIFIIMLALCADAVIGNIQEKVMKQFNCSNIEMVLYSCSIGFVYILVGLVLTGNILPAARFCYQHPTSTYGYAFIFSITGYLGLISVLTLVKSFGALVAVTVTTCRKALTIVLSFMFFTKPFTVHYLWSGLIVILGIGLNVYSKNRKSTKINWFLYTLHRIFGRKSNQYIGMERII